MPQEIERKFLLKNNDWNKEISISTEIRQGYLSLDNERNVRVRIKGEKGILTIKGKTENISRKEFEYEIPKFEAEELLSLCHRPLIEKIRHEIVIGNHTWEIDEFLGENKGLIVAEIELESEQESFEKPIWLGKEVSDDARYYNASLVKLAFKNW
ncbi:MAG: adenylate cyclase [Maribacter sp.]|jgi:adenylate cyclase